MASRIDWQYPAPRKGWAGALDKFIGPGATRAEITWQFGVAGAFAVAMVLLAWWQQLGWSTAQYIVGAFIALDIGGGISTNSTSSAKRWYHRAGQGFGAHFGFTALHIIQILLVAWMFLGWNWVYIAVGYGYLLLAALVLLLTAHYMQRSVGIVLAAVGIVICLYALPAAPGMEWFMPLLYVKLLVSHLQKEEPYYPAE